MLFVHIGSMNPQKLASVEEEFRAWGKEAAFLGENVTSGVAEQPKSLETIYAGAMHRAREALPDYTRKIDVDAFPVQVPMDGPVRISVGLESGLFRPGPVTNGWMDIAVCALHAEYAGESERWAFGLSEAFTIPKDIEAAMTKHACDLSTAARLAGYTDHPKIGEAGGIVSILSHGRVTRRDQLRSSIRMALIHFDSLL